MASRPYVNERQSEYWTSHEIQNFFKNDGFDVTAYPITQLTEKKLPSDFLFLDGRTNKLFGFQYKALYHNRDDFWILVATTAFSRSKMYSSRNRYMRRARCASW